MKSDLEYKELAIFSFIGVLLLVIILGSVIKYF